MRDASLLEVMIRTVESDGAFEDPACRQPAIYAFALRAYRTLVECGYPTERGRWAGTLVNSRQPGRRGYSAWRKDCGLRHPLDRKDPWRKIAAVPPSVDMIDKWRYRAFCRPGRRPRGRVLAPQGERTGETGPLFRNPGRSRGGRRDRDRAGRCERLRFNNDKAEVRE